MLLAAKCGVLNKISAFCLPLRSNFVLAEITIKSETIVICIGHTHAANFALAMPVRTLP